MDVFVIVEQYYEDVVDVEVKQDIRDVVKHVYDSEVKYGHDVNLDTVDESIKKYMSYSGYSIFKKQI